MTNYQEILEEFYKSDSCPKNWPRDWQNFKKPQIRKNSIIYKLESKESGLKIVLKVIENPKKPNQLVENIYNSYITYQQHYSPSYSVPNHLGFIKNHNALIIEYIELPSLKYLLLKGFFNNLIRTKSIESTAKWLDWFHSCKPLSSGTEAISTKLKTLEARTRKIQQSKPSFVNKLIGFETLFSQTKSIVRSIQVEEIAIASLHGDFKPSNIMTNFEKTIGIDFSPSRSGYVTEDICRILSHFDLHRKLFTKSISIGIDNPANDFSKFRDFYGKKAAINHQLFLFLYLLTILDRLSARVIHLESDKLNLLQIIVALRLKKIAQDILKHLQKV